VSDNVIVVDLLHNGAAFVANAQLTPANRAPIIAAARALRSLGLPLDTPVTLRRFGQTVRHSSISFLLRPDAAVVTQ
jgi:hypothetical protein